MSRLNEAVHPVRRMTVAEFEAETGETFRQPTPMTPEQQEAASRRIDAMIIDFQTVQRGDVLSSLDRP